MEKTQNKKQESSLTNDIVSQIIQYSPTCCSVQGSSMPLIDKFNVQYLTSLLDRAKIQSINKVYESKKDGFNLLEFVRFFLNAIEHQEIETLYLTMALIDFYKEICQLCGHNDRLYFIDITNYICNRIHQQRAEQNQIESKCIPDYRTIVPNFKQKDYLLNPPRIFASKEETVYKLSLNKSKIKIKHQRAITNCYFSATLMKIFLLEDLSDSILVYNVGCSLLKKIKPNPSKFKKDAVILSFAYSQRQQRIGAALKDASLSFWDNGDNFQFEKSISISQHCQQCQTYIRFLQYFNCWITSDKSGWLYVWNLTTEKPDRIIRLETQTQINDLTVIPCINLIAIVQERKIYVQHRGVLERRKKKQKVNSIECRKKQIDNETTPMICLYDFLKGEMVAKIQLSSENRYPHTLQYCQNYDVLLSAGYEKTILVFEINKTFLDVCKKGELTGHQSLITSFVALKKSPMVVSADDKGKVKIWDIRNYKCVQTLDFRDKTNVTKIVDMLQLGKICLLGSRITFVEFEDKMEIQKKLQTKKKSIPMWVQYDHAAEELLLMTKTDFRVIDMHRGIVKNINCQFHDEDSEITYFKYFQTLQKFVIGNEKGETKLYCIRTGRLCGQLADQCGSIVYVEYDQKNKIFVTMGQSSVQIQKYTLDYSSDKISHTESSESKGESCKLKNNNMSKSINIITKEDKQFEDYLFNCNKNDVTVNENKLLTNTAQNNLKESKVSAINFNGKQITLGCVSVYHGFVAVCSTEKKIFIWDYQLLKLLIQIQLPGDANVEPTALAFINGFSILVLGTSDGTVYFIKVGKLQRGYKIKTIGIFKSQKQSPIINITIDILIKGFLPNKQKFVHCDVYLGHLCGQITNIKLTEKLSTFKIEPTILQSKHFNGERQLKENFTTEVSRKRYQTYTINTNLDEPLIGEIGTIPSMSTSREGYAVTFEAHKGNLTGMSIVRLDECFLISIGMDEKLKIWKENRLICDWNVNLPLPFKWDIIIGNNQKMGDKIMFALKIVQQIFEKYGNDISINESKCLKVRKLFDTLKQPSQSGTTLKNSGNFLTQPTHIEKTNKRSPLLFQNEFSKKDMHYDYVKKFSLNEIAGPTLREIDVQKKLNTIQQQWTVNQEKAEKANNKLLMNIRKKTHQNEEKQQLLQFFSSQRCNKSAENQKQSSPYIVNLMKKIENIISPKSNKKETVDISLSNTTLGFGSIQQNIRNFSSDNKIKRREDQRWTVRSLEKKKIMSNTLRDNQQMFSKKKDRSMEITFEKYYELMENMQSTVQSPTVSQCNSRIHKISANFRNILTNMNNKIKHSKIRKMKQDKQQIMEDKPFGSVVVAMRDEKRCITKD